MKTEKSGRNVTRARKKTRATGQKNLSAGVKPPSRRNSTLIGAWVKNDFADRVKKHAEANSVPVATLIRNLLTDAIK